MATNKTSSNIERLYNAITFSNTFKRFSASSDAMSVYRDYFLERLSDEKAGNICDLNGYVDSYTLLSDPQGEIYEDTPIDIGDKLCDLFIESALANKGTLTATALIDTVRNHIIAQEEERHYINSYYVDLLGNLPSTYRTKGRAKDIVDMPEELYISTSESMKYALTFNQNKATRAHMEIAEMTENLEFKDGILMIKGMPASRMALINYQTKTGVDEVDLMLLRALYSVMLVDADNQIQLREDIRDTIKIYAPAFLKYTGRNFGLGTDNFQALIKDINNYQSVYGALKDEDGNSETFYQVLNISSYNPDDNTLEISSPYMSNIIKNIYDTRIATGVVPQSAIDANDINTLFETTSLVKHEIGKERNKIAVEIVVYIVRKIAQAGSGKVVKVTVKELFKNIPELQYVINEKISPNTGKPKTLKDKNKYMKRIFSKAWELLESKTYLTSSYPWMKLPEKDDPNVIPSVQDLDMEFTFDTALDIEQ